jgi:Uma2 family endonuclease
MARAAHRSWTYEDLLALPDDGLRHELIDGEHYVSPAPTTKHQRVLLKLTLALGNFVERHGSGELFFAPCDVFFSRRDVVEPDLIFVARGGEAVVAEACIQGAPDLLVEVLSPSTRKIDEGVKLRLFERTGVGEYWLADPGRATVKIHRRAGEALRAVAELSAEAGDVLTTPLLPGLEVPLRGIFA